MKSLEDWQELFLADVREERERQDQQWGGEDHDEHLSDLLWNAILADFTGRVSKCVKREGYLSSDRDELHRLLVKVAAIATAWGEKLQREANT